MIHKMSNKWNLEVELFVASINAQVIKHVYYIHVDSY